MDCENCGGDNGVPMATGQGVQSLCASCRCSIPPAPPSKPKSPADELRDLVAVMREMGVTEYERGDVKLKLGAAKVESPPITDAQRRAMAEETKKQHDALLYASSEGFPVDEEGQPA